MLFIEASLLPAGDAATSRSPTARQRDAGVARAAVSHIRSITKDLGVAADFNTHDLHIHVPAGAIPDGPSAE